MLKRHVVLTLGRSGSNTLVDMLNQHPAVLNLGEVLGEWNQIRRMQRVSGLFRGNDAAYIDALLGNVGLQRLLNKTRNIKKRAAGTPEQVKVFGDLQAIGIKEFSLNFDSLGLESFLERRPDIKVIGLLRENVLARAVSAAVLENTGVVHSRQLNVPRTSGFLKMEADELLQRLQAAEQEYERLLQYLEVLAPERVMRISYEEAFAGQASLVAAVRQVYEFLQLEDYRPEIHLKKLTTNDPMAVFEQSEGLRLALASTRFQRWLYD